MILIIARVARLLIEERWIFSHNREISREMDSHYIMLNITTIALCHYQCLLRITNECLTVADCREKRNLSAEYLHHAAPK